MSLVRFVIVAALVTIECVHLTAAHAQVVPVGGQFQVNTYTTGFQGLPAVAADASGNFVVVWDDEGAGQVLKGRRFDAAGGPLGGEFQVNSDTTTAGYNPAVGSDASGNFVVAWADSNSGVLARRFDSAGVPLGG